MEESASSREHRPFIVLFRIVCLPLGLGTCLMTSLKAPGVMINNVIKKAVTRLNLWT